MVYFKLLLLIIVNYGLFQNVRDNKSSQINSLCSYQNKTLFEASEKKLLEPCVPGEFIVAVTGIEGTLRYHDDLKSYVVISIPEESYDCQIIGALCDVPADVRTGKVIYSANFFEYRGGFKPPMGGQKLFVVKEFSFR